MENLVLCVELPIPKKKRDEFFGPTCKGRLLVLVNMSPPAESKYKKYKTQKTKNKTYKKLQTKNKKHKRASDI